MSKFSFQSLVLLFLIAGPAYAEGDEELRRDARYQYLNFDVQRYDATRQYSISYNSAPLLDICTGKNFNYEQCLDDISRAYDDLEKLVRQAKETEALRRPTQSDSVQEPPSVSIVQQNIDNCSGHIYRPGRDNPPVRPSHHNENVGIRERPTDKSAVPPISAPPQQRAQWGRR